MEGTVEFKIPGVSKSCQTWYKVVGDLNAPNSTPLIILHGGPAASHDYLLPLTDLAPTVPIIFYDQIGGGRSTHLPEKAGDKTFWVIELFMQELDNLLTHLGLSQKPFDLYGHSWGGILAVTWASTPSAISANLRRLIISNIPASAELYMTALATLRKQLPEETQAALDRGEAKMELTSPEYMAALEVFGKKHLSLARPWPSEEVQALYHWQAKGLDVYTVVYGPNQFLCRGTISTWNSIPSLHKIKAQTLVIDGTEDMPAEAVQPLFDHIEKVKWVTLDNAAHFTHVDQRDKYMRHLRAFLTV